MYVCVFFVCFHCLPVFIFLFLFLSNNYLSLHTLRFYTGMLFCLFTKLKYTEYKCFSSFHIFWYTMTVVEIVLIDYCNYVLSSYFKKAYYFKKKAFFCQTFYDTSLFWQSFSIFGRSMNNSMCFILSCFLHWLPEPYDYPSWCVILVFSVHATGAAIFISEWLSPQGLNRGATPLRGNGEVNQAVRRGSTHFFFLLSILSLLWFWYSTSQSPYRTHTPLFGGN